MKSIWHFIREKLISRIKYSQHEKQVLWKQRIDLELFFFNVNVILYIWTALFLKLV